MNLEPFVYAAEQRSFSDAARRLGVSPAAVSKAVAKMESDLGVQLLTRTSRRVSLTAEGAVWLEHCRAALDALDAGRQRLSEAVERPRGRVRISASPVLGGVLASVVAALGAQHPELELCCQFTDALVSLANDEADLALRVGHFTDSALKSRKLWRSRWVTVASPAYLADAPPLNHPSDLHQHRCLRYLAPSGRSTPWSWRDLDLQPPTSAQLGDGNALIEAVLAGAGVAQVFDFSVRDALVAGRLVQVLAPWAAPGPQVHLVIGPGKRSLARVAAVIDALVDGLSGLAS